MTLATPPDLARIPAGDFLMGASNAQDDERPVHRVYVSEFFISRFSVTHDEYARFIQATGQRAPSIRELPLIASGGRDGLFEELAAAYVWEDGHPPAGHGSHPVVLVPYDDAVAYCRWLSDALGRIARLPTEAEWEKAARGGTDGQRYPWGDDIDPSRGNFLSDPAVKNERGTRPTGTYPPNGYGLYDMAGNVWEWTVDRFEQQTINACCAPQRDDAGERYPRHVIKGGSHLCAPNYCLRYRPAARQGETVDTTTSHIGFRCVVRPG